jgi:phosphopantothenoylcysteine decarboxylase
MGDPVLHIQLRDWADMLLIAPLSAHTLAKISHGLCDDTVSCVARAWEYGHGGRNRGGKPLLLAPAMNTAMWDHPITRSQFSTIQRFWNVSLSVSNDGEVINSALDDGDGGDDDDGRNCPCGVHIIAPQVKTLACGEVGNGALASVDDILQMVRRILQTLDLK